MLLSNLSTMPTKKFNWGIIGLGKIAHKFASDLQTIPDAKLHAVASSDALRAKDFAAKYDATFAFGSYQALMDCPDLDAIYIATPHSAHCEMTLLCLQHKIPVLCEKPFAMNFLQVEKMIAMSRENNTFLMEALWTRFLPTTDLLLSLIEKNSIGKILSVHADFGFYLKFDAKSRLYNKDLGGGSLLDVGIYPIYLSLLLLGKPTKIQAKAAFGKSDVDESCAMIFDYADAQQMAVLKSSIREKTPTEAYIYGEKGKIRLHGRFHEPNIGITLEIYGEEPIFYPFEWDCIGYAYEAKEVMRCVRAGEKESKTMSHAFSLDLILTLDEVRKVANIEYYL